MPRPLAFARLSAVAATVALAIPLPPAARAEGEAASAVAPTPSSPAFPPTEQPALFTVKPYGFLNAEVERVDATGGATPYRARGRVSDGNSRLGFAGIINLTYNFKAVWQVEGGLGSFDQGGVNDQGTSTTLVVRNTFVGVFDQRIGRLVFGNNDSAYRTLVGSAGEFGGNLGLTKTGLDLWNNTSAQISGNADSIFSRGEDRYKNSIHFDSRVLYGLSAAGSYAFDEAIAGGRLRQRYSIGLKYTRGPISVGVGHDHRSHTGVNLDRLRFGTGFLVDGQIGVSTNFYKALAVVVLPTKTSLAAGYEYGVYGYADFTPPSTTDYYAQLGTGKMQQSAGMASLSQTLLRDRLVLMAAAGKLWKLRNAVVGMPEDYEAWQLSVGVKVMLGDRFSAYAYYTDIRNHAGQNVNLGQAPLYSDKLGTSAAYLAPGNDPRALGAGMIARF